MVRHFIFETGTVDSTVWNRFQSEEAQNRGSGSGTGTGCQPCSCLEANYIITVATFSIISNVLVCGYWKQFCNHSIIIYVGLPFPKRSAKYRRKGLFGKRGAIWKLVKKSTHGGATCERSTSSSKPFHRLP